jgi:hypothetical protein
MLMKGLGINAAVEVGARFMETDERQRRRQTRIKRKMENNSKNLLFVFFFFSFGPIIYS